MEDVIIISWYYQWFVQDFLKLVHIQFKGGVRVGAELILKENILPPL